MVSLCSRVEGVFCSEAASWLVVSLSKNFRQSSVVSASSGVRSGSSSFSSSSSSVALALGFGGRAANSPTHQLFNSEGSVGNVASFSNNESRFSGT